MGLLDKVKETAQKGVDKAKEGVQAGQEKLEERKLEKKIAELKEELGGIVYAQKTGSAAVNADAEVTRIVGEIKATETELDQLAAEEASGSDAAGGEAAAGA
jgi:hypothetical protein